MLDADQLRQVFVNLLANATDASADGGIITITTERATSKPGVSEQEKSTDVSCNGADAALSILS
jgi:signal transduction histidine kinase